MAAKPPLPKWRLLARAVGISARVAKHWTRFWIGWVLLWVRAAGRDRRRAWLGRVVVDLFRELGATFIKVGQIMSTRPDLIPEYLSNALSELQDQVGPFPFEEVVRTIEADFGRPVASIYAEFSPVPLASASVSQVHKARLTNGRIVAVKVRRPDVVALCTFDLAVMRQGARLLGLVPSISTLAPLATVEEFGRAIFAQLDFRVEASNNLRFRSNFAGHPEVVFPEVVEALSTERILTMSFIEGTKILSTPATRSDPKRVARLGLQTLMKMIFEDGFVHADLHPGNIFITPDDKLALLDLGLVGELDEPHRKGFARFFAAWAQRDGDAMAHIMYGLSEGANRPRDPEAFERYRAAIIEFVGRYWGYRLGQVQVGKVLLDMLGILRRHRVRVNPSFTIVNIAIAVTEGIGKQLDPELDLMSEAIPFFMAHKMYADQNTGQP
ncbi:MAG TPA: AarF/UbiB family protein [Polyangia bacterium]|nr:AarF/UbiB family protein [Polyangia bacterium]